MPANEDERLTVSQAARELGVSEKTTRRLINNGELPAYKPTPRIIRVSRKDLDAFLESHKTVSANSKGGG